MKLKNKLTGEINILKVDEDYFNIYQEDGDFVCPVTLKELNEGWEDYYEEPKEYWCIRENGVVGKRPYPIFIECVEQENRDAMREIGNYFSSREEAEKAVERLRAWKRLKDKGFRFGGWKRDERFWGDYTIEAQDYTTCDDKDLDICFGGEE